MILLLACAGDALMPVPGTTTRVEEPTANSHGAQQFDVRMIPNVDECHYLETDPGERDACLLYVDRATGQVRVAFQVRADQRTFAIPLEQEQVEVFHKNQEIQAEGGNRLELIPHDPQRSPQLFILVIDTSGSMNLVDADAGADAEDDEGRITRMDKIRRALLRRDVVDSFFPPEGTENRVKTAVVPLVFAGSGLPQPLGGTWIVEDPATYRRLIRENLRVGTGYTFLYQAVEYAATTLLQEPNIKQAIAALRMQPTIIALTDGFNNLNAGQLCGENAALLTELLKKLGRARREARAGEQPEVYTVGLGRPAWKSRPGVPPPSSEPEEVRPADLCRGWAESRIDGGAETLGVDNEALLRMARVGGGESYIRRNTDGLAQAFKAAAALRYRWFEVRYDIDAFYLRRKFATKVRLQNLFGIEGQMVIHPSGWLDGPPGITDGEGWARPAPFRHTLRLLLPGLALLILLGYVPAALYNARRPFRARIGRR